MEVSNQKGLRCFYIGSSQNTLDLIDKTLSEKYKNITFGFFSPPFKKEFSEEDSNFMISKINAFKPNVVFVGMTAPKQEKRVNAHKDKIDANIICSIGAVFDFVAGTIKRAPQWVIDLRLEWLYRSFTGTRLAKRYLYSTPLFLIEVFKLKYFGRHKKNA